MYLSAFPAAFDRWGELPQSGTDPDDCRNAGGVPSYADQSGRAYDGLPITNVVRGRFWKCQMPTGGSRNVSPPANITVTVPTQVSPQISPQFIQQQQPTNSPIGVALSDDTQTTREPDTALIDLLRQAMTAPQTQTQQPQFFVPPPPATPESFVPSGEQQIESPGPMGIPLPFLFAAGLLGAALVFKRAKKRK